jgi:antitoxin YefM
METLSLAEVKARFSELAREVEQTHERITVTRNGKPVVVLIARDDLEALEETLSLALDTKARERVSEARRALDAGEGSSVDDLRAAITAREHPGA